MSERVLIIDDHAGFRASARKLLHQQGFEVVGEAGDAASGIEAVHDLHPDIVLMDIQLPDLNGVQASARIAALNGGSAVILISTHDLDDAKSALAESAARGFIPKSELDGAAIRALVASS